MAVAVLMTEILQEKWPEKDGRGLDWRTRLRSKLSDLNYMWAPLAVAISPPVCSAPAGMTLHRLSVTHRHGHTQAARNACFFTCTWNTWHTLAEWFSKKAAQLCELWVCLIQAIYFPVTSRCSATDRGEQWIIIIKKGGGGNLNNFDSDLERKVQLWF